MEGEPDTISDKFGNEYKRISGGTFNFGDESGFGLKRELPTTMRTVVNSFYVGIHPVTQSLWESIMGDNPAKHKNDFFDGLNPVESVSWHEVAEFIEIINKEYPLTEYGVWRLPREFEWEYFAKAGTSTRWSFGDLDKDLDEYGWHAGNSGGRPKYVGQKKANLWGLFDLHGNVAEWCSDDWRKDHHHNTQPNPLFKVHRGGSWYTESDSTRSSARGKGKPEQKYDGVGFRLVWQPI